MLSKSLVVVGTVTLITLIIFWSAAFPANQALQQATAQEFTLPATIATYGNAWNGLITFDLSSNTQSTGYLVVMYTNGTVVSLRTTDNGGYGVSKNIAQNEILFQGEPQYTNIPGWDAYATHIWNVTANTTEDFPNVYGHHDVEYDPINNTFLTLQDYVRQVGDDSILCDRILELDASGNVLWSWDTYDHIPLSEADPYNLTTTYNGEPVIDFTHANTLLWDYNDSVIYLNVRNTDTFYKINQTTGNLIWACGEFGNFTLLTTNGTPVSSLWYHSHDLEEIAPDVFTMFNNDFDNRTNVNDANSQIIEFTLNEQNMTAQENWSWTAPEQYYTQYLGAADLLPNGDWLGDFGSPTHQFPENQPWNFADTGAALIEVNPAGQIVRTITFPTSWFIYRSELVTNLSQNAFNFSTSPSPAPTASSTPTIFPTPTTFTTPTLSTTTASNPTPPPTKSPTPPPNTSPTPSSSTSPTPTVAQTPFSSPLSSPTPTQPTSSSPSQIPSNQPSPSPTPSPNSFIAIDAALIIIAIVIVAAAILIIIKRRKNS